MNEPQLEYGETHAGKNVFRTCSCHRCRAPGDGSVGIVRVVYCHAQFDSPRCYWCKHGGQRDDQAFQ